MQETTTCPVHRVILIRRVVPPTSWRGSSPQLEDHEAGKKIATWGVIIYSQLIAKLSAVVRERKRREEAARRQPRKKERMMCLMKNRTSGVSNEVKEPVSTPVEEAPCFLIAHLESDTKQLNMTGIGSNGGSNQSPREGKLKERGSQRRTINASSRNSIQNNISRQKSGEAVRLEIPDRESAAGTGRLTKDGRAAE